MQSVVEEHGSTETHERDVQQHCVGAALASDLDIGRGEKSFSLFRQGGRVQENSIYGKEPN